MFSFPPVPKPQRSLTSEDLESMLFSSFTVLRNLLHDITQS